MPAAVAAKVPHLPESPGVYLWKDAEGRVVYVGKAKRLRSRVRSYVSGEAAASIKTEALLRQVADLETIVVPTEAHALILEANLIKEYRPRFNIALRDDKSYPYIKVTVQEPFPRVLVTRRVLDDGGRYFGPYTDVGAMRRALNVVKQLFTVRSCRYDMPREMPERPCLDYYIKRCKAPCILAQTQAEYRAMIDEVIEFLEGHSDDVIAAGARAHDGGRRAPRLRAGGRAARRAQPARAAGGADGRAGGGGRRPRHHRLRARRRRCLRGDPQDSRRQAAGPGPSTAREREGGDRRRGAVGVPCARVRGRAGPGLRAVGPVRLRGSGGARGVGARDAGDRATARAQTRDHRPRAAECPTSSRGVPAGRRRDG